MRKIVIAATLFAAVQGVARAQSAPDQPKIIVDGYGEVKTPPDVATITYTLRGEGSTSDDAVRAMVASGQRIESALKNLDPGIEPKTREVRVSPAKGQTCEGERYDADEKLSKGPCAITGYIANQSITIRTAAVKDSGTMVGLAAKGGAYEVRISNFDLADPRSAKAQAISAALADAQVKAGALARGSHLTLGPIMTISTVGMQGSQDIVITGSRIPAPNAGFTTPVTVNLNAEQITTSATVAVTFAIAR